ncbi:peptide-methionine (S)-S-oxide reductase [Christiangramia sp.]|uniref:peptide-methionine (S)-S-oxide reductase n=1 Tax=Christiangramia sp. TaxID=1931228 RepID=UPI00260E8C4B|nr:peptide-methionine (S)-S-oxide reductase [Christiangramia sp.]
MENLEKIGFGGGCHWCTEAIFQVVKGIKKVDQGYISINAAPEKFYEGVLVYFNPKLINLEELIKIHLETHQSLSNHSMRSKYLSAVYTFNEPQQIRVAHILNKLQQDEQKEIITKAYTVVEFKESREEIRNYYKTDPERPFCRLYIEPKLELLKEKYPNSLN